MNKILECGRTTYGFVDHSLRRELWPIVLCIKDSEPADKQESNHEHSDLFLRRRNESKIIAKKDANRSFVNLDDLDPKSRFSLQ